MRNLILGSALTAVLLIAAGCASKGTLVTQRVLPGDAPRAVDQAILADAVDAAFAQINVDGIARALGTNASSDAYVEVSAPFPLTPHLREYAYSRTAAVAGSIGLRVLEIERIMERPTPDKQLQILQTVYPNTAARVLLMISYAGVDEEAVLDEHEAHGTSKPERIMRGRFKATFSVVPRAGSFRGTYQIVEGSSKYDIVEGRYLGKR